MSSNVRNRLKFGKQSRKDLLCGKRKKNGYGEFDHSGTLRYQYIPTDHHSLAPLYGQTFDANPSKVYIF